ncbi:MAG: ATP-binding protein [Nitrospirota bacterium]
MAANAQKLNEAFQTFTRASESLASYYELLQDRIAYLTTELELKNRELNKALARAEQSTDYLNAILYNLEDAIIVVDPDDRIEMMNRSAESLFHCSADVSIGRLFSELDIVLRKEGAETVLAVHRKRSPVIVSYSDIPDASGYSRGRVILIRDITRLRELEVQQERNQRLISMGEMAVRIVHEIRNPLCSMELYATMLEQELANTGHQELAHGISTGIGNLNTILTNMLFFARPRTPAMAVIDLETVIRESVEMLLPLFTSRRIAITHLSTSCRIRGDAELLKQVFLNIMMNAVQAMPEGGEIMISLTRQDGMVRVDIADTGEGILPENVEKIFNPFFTTKDSGTGLGLAIASKIMQTHDGYITATSKAGKGSAFSLLFPGQDTFDCGKTDHEKSATADRKGD